MYGTELLRSRRCAPPRDRGVQPRRVLSNRESAASTSGGLGRNPEGLAAALREILSDLDLAERMSAAARVASETFDADRFVDALERTYVDLAKPP